MTQQTDLEAKIHEQAREIRNMQRAAEEKNLMLDTLHMVWCDGGCVKGSNMTTKQLRRFLILLWANGMLCGVTVEGIATGHASGLFLVAEIVIILGGFLMIAARVDDMTRQLDP